MPEKDLLGVTDAETSRSRKRSKSRSPSRKSKQGTSPPPPPRDEAAVTKLGDDVDLGVKDNDIFLLPSSDYSIMATLTVIAVVVRLFRIYQPTSVVFDEVQ